jgi:hypothetical protein
MKRYPFNKSVIWFCLLNIYIIISWHDWRYGGSYSTRALSQSYPVFALPLAALIEQINLRKWRFVFYLLAAWLVFVNLFQINQYNHWIIHNNDMNRKYYGRVYLNNHPTPLDMSLLDNDEFLSSESGYNAHLLFNADTLMHVKAVREQANPFFTIPINSGLQQNTSHQTWLRIEAEINISEGFSGSYLSSQLQAAGSVKQNQIRLFSPTNNQGQPNKYAFYICIPNSSVNYELQLLIRSKLSGFDGTISKLTVTALEN